MPQPALTPMALCCVAWGDGHTTSVTILAPRKFPIRNGKGGPRNPLRRRGAATAPGTCDYNPSSKGHKGTQRLTMRRQQCSLVCPFVVQGFLSGPSLPCGEEINRGIRQQRQATRPAPPASKLDVRGAFFGVLGARLNLAFTQRKSLE